jgi:Uma2 family endonuclease
MTLADPPISQQFLLEDADWQFYEALLRRIGDRRIFVTYDSGRLEIMSPSYRHDRHSRRLALLINIISEELRIPILGGGSTTFRRKDLDKGLEPDECFYVQNVSRVIGKEELDLSVDPPPDLAVEVEVTRRLLPRMPIYQSLGVPELWRDDGEHVEVYVLDRVGDYRPVSRSLSFPDFPIDQIDHLLAMSKSLDDMNWTLAIRSWAKQNLR